MNENRRVLIIIQLIIIALSLIQVFNILPTTGMAGMFAACAIWALLVIRKA